MILAELGKELEKDKRAYNSTLLANYNNCDFPITELIYDDDGQILYFLCEDVYDVAGISPKDVVKEYKKKYKNNYTCKILNVDLEFIKNVSYVGLRCGDKNFGESDNKILY
jgi:hypothetical protein